MAAMMSPYSVLSNAIPAFTVDRTAMVAKPQATPGWHCIPVSSGLPVLYSGMNTLSHARIPW